MSDSRRARTHLVEGARPGPGVLIVGGGVAGLATGCYLQMNGFNSHILERHQLPGGCCTAWERKGYVFDYCIEWLLGSGPDNQANQVWQELGALQGKTVQNFELFNRVISAEGEEVNFYNDPDRLQQHMLEVAPEDAKAIGKFCDAIRGFLKVDMYPDLSPKPLQKWRQKWDRLARVLPSFMLFWRTGAMSMEAFAERLQSPFLRQAMPFIFFQDHECFPILPYVYNMAEAHKGNAGFPQGGSLGLARSIEKRYLELGGKITYGSKVSRIVTEPFASGRYQATGVVLKNGARWSADYVVSAADGYTTLYHMLEARFISETQNKLYTQILERKEMVYPGVVSVFVGFKGTVGEGEPHSTTYLLHETNTSELPECMQRSVLLQHRSRFTEGFAPPGCSVIHLTYLSEFDNWQQWRSNDKAYYRQQKSRIEKWVRNFLEDRYPGINERIELVEIATPVTQKLYTGNTRGSILGWKSFTEAEDLANKIISHDHMQVPGLDNFYMAGHWVGGGGLIRSALSGRYVAQFLCAELGKEFQALPVQAKTDYRWNNVEWQFGRPAKSRIPGGVSGDSFSSKSFDRRS